MYRRILVPLDGTAVENEVLTHASTLARNSNAELVLLRVLPGDCPDPLFQTPWMQLTSERQQESIRLLARGSLERVAEKLRASHLRVSTRVATGGPVDAILRAAAAAQADVIVMSAYGVKAEQPWLDERVAARLLHEASVPVFLVGGGQHGLNESDSSQRAGLQR